MACAPSLRAQPAPERPSSATRYVQTFDFEERLTNPNPVPRHWSRVYDPAATADGTPVRPTLPRWNQAELVFMQDGFPAAGGSGSARLPTSGGSTRMALDPGVIPVFAGADYRILAKVHTEGLKFAKARVLVRFLERDGSPIHASEKSTDLITSPDGWTSIALELVGEHLRASYLQIQLDLLQPAQFPGAVSEKQAALREDYSGSASFDDIEVIQLPRAEITTSAPLNIGIWPDVPELTARVRDMTGEKLSLRIETFDSRGTRVSMVEKQIAGAERISYVPEVKDLGWYRAVMTISADSVPVGVDSVDFGVVPHIGTVPGEVAAKGARPGRISSPDRRIFGVIAGKVPTRILGEIEAIPQRIGTGAITLDATGESTEPESPLAQAVSRVLEEWQEVTLLVTRLNIPSASADRPLNAIGSSKEAVASLEPLLDRFGQRVGRFQFARPNDDGWFWEPEAHNPSDAVKVLRRYVSGPIISMPMRLDRATWITPSESVDAVFFVPYGVQPGAVGAAVEELKLVRPRAGERQPMTLAFECPPDGHYSPRDSASTIVRRALEAWIASPAAVPNMALIEPWSILGPRRPQLMPKAELIAWRSLSDRLLDRRVVAVFPSPVGTRAYLLAPTSSAPAGRGGAIVAWNDSAPANDAVLDAFLGEGSIRVVDIFGNQRPPRPALRQGQASRDSGIRVPLGNEPVFIEGVDTSLARFLCDFRLEPGTIEPGTASSDHQLVLRNPFSTGISGTITLLSPSREEQGGVSREWKITPRVMRFAAGPGETATIPMAIAAGSGLELGAQPFVFQVDLSAEVQYPRLEITRDLNVGLSNVRVSMSYRVQDNGDLILDVALANISDAPLNLRVTAFAPDQPRQTSTVSGLQPSNQSIRRFLYQGLAQKLRGTRLSISLVDADSNVRVADSIEIN